MLKATADYKRSHSTCYEINDCIQSSPIKVASFNSFLTNCLLKVSIDDDNEIDYGNEYYEPSSSPQRAYQRNLFLSYLEIHLLDVYSKDSPSIGIISDFEQSSFNGDNDIKTIPIEPVQL